jgi:hypothetical protein
VLFFGFASLFQLSAQKTPVYYLTGRPLDIPRNNAIRMLGIQYGVTFEYAGSDIYDVKGYEGIERHNDSIQKLISKKSHYGIYWLDTLYQQLEVRLALHEKVRNTIVQHKVFMTNSTLLVEPILLITKEKKQKKFEIQLIGQYIDNAALGYHCLQKFTISLPSEKIRLQECSSSLPFLLPENGIERVLSK